MKAKRDVVLSFAMMFAMMFVVGCVSGSPPPQQPSGGGVGSGGGTGTGGDGSGSGSSGSGSGSGTGSGSGSGSGTGTGTGTGGGTGSGGTSAPKDGCGKYVMCLGAAMSDADAMACDTNASMSATQLLDAADKCAFDYCTGTAGGGTARCTVAADGSPTNPDGTPAFDMNGAPSGDCADCLLNVEAGLFGEPCQPANDAACNASACAQAVSACQNN